MPATHSASLALQSAVVAALSANASLTAATGGTARIYDDVPPKTPYPYLAIGQTIERDWSTGTDDGREHTLTLHVWSRTPGRREIHDIAALVRATLHQAALTLDGHRLINIRHEFTDARREPDNENLSRPSPLPRRHRTALAASRAGRSGWPRDDTQVALLPGQVAEEPPAITSSSAARPKAVGSKFATRRVVTPRSSQVARSAA